MAVRMAPDVQGVQDVCKAQLRVVWGTILFRVFWWCLGCVEPSCPQSDTEHRACSIMLANKHSIWTVLLIYDHKLHKQWVTANQLSRFTLTGKLSTWHHSSLSHTKTKPSQLRSTHSLTHTGEQNTNANTPLISPVTADHPTHTHTHIPMTARIPLRIWTMPIRLPPQSQEMSCCDLIKVWHTFSKLQTLQMLFLHH